MITWKFKDGPPHGERIGQTVQYQFSKVQEQVEVMVQAKNNFQYSSYAKTFKESYTIQELIHNLNLSSSASNVIPGHWVLFSATVEKGSDLTFDWMITRNQEIVVEINGGSNIYNQSQLVSPLRHNHNDTFQI